MTLANSEAGLVQPRPIPDGLTHEVHTALWAGVALALVVIGGRWAFDQGLTPDVAWYLYAAERMLHGARLYRDMIEVNPPLVVLLDIPVVLIARALHVSVTVVFNVYVLVLVTGAALFAAGILGNLEGRGRGNLPSASLAATLAALLLVVRGDYGQREHLFFSLLLPYLALAAVRPTDRRRSTELAAGGLAAVGIGLKPHFVAVWLGIEAFLVWRQRSWRSLLRPECIVVAAVMTIYLAAIAIFWFDYVALLRQWGSTYLSFLPETFEDALLRPEVILVALSVAALKVLPTRPALRPFRALLAVAAILLAIMAVLQRKGWPYHYYPALGAALLIFSLTDVRRTLAAAAHPLRRITVCLLTGALAVCVVVVGAERLLGARHHATRNRELILHDLVPLLERHGSGVTVYALASTMAPAFPVVNYAGATWGGRFPALWVLSAIYAPATDDPQSVGREIRPHPSEGMSWAEREVRRTVVADVLANRPSVIIVDDHRSMWAFRGQYFDYLGYFCRDSRFADVMRSYTRGRRGDYLVLERRPRATPDSSARGDGACGETEEF